MQHCAMIALDDSHGCLHAGPRQCIGRALARILHDASVAQLVSHFRFQLAERMGGPEGVDRHEINRLTMQPGQGEPPSPAMLICRNSAGSTLVGNSSGPRNMTI